MKYIHAKISRPQYDTMVTSFFLFWPKTLCNVENNSYETRWLEKASIVFRYKTDFLGRYGKWVPTQWK